MKLFNALKTRTTKIIAATALAAGALTLAATSVRATSCPDRCITDTHTTATMATRTGTTTIAVATTANHNGPGWATPIQDVSVPPVIRRPGCFNLLRSPAAAHPTLAY